MALLYINLVIAFIWMALSPDPNPKSLAIGFVAGFLILWLFDQLYKEDTYVRRTLGFLKFVLMFLKALVLSSIEIARSIILLPNNSIHPNFITFDVTGMTKFEIILLTHCITLTPGTTSVLLEDDFNTLYIHAFGADDPKAVRDSIENDLKKYILGFTR
ncbi:Na+/H+ antiporter subunit E [bacterium]|jgi:multicomponent Na+:H+ antiporter subunit E|nr:Na+/H+ antiporter subunit E [bacterium]